MLTIIMFICAVSNIVSYIFSSLSCERERERLIMRIVVCDITILPVLAGSSLPVEQDGVTSDGPAYRRNCC